MKPKFSFGLWLRWSTVFGLILTLAHPWAVPEDESHMGTFELPIFVDGEPRPLRLATGVDVGSAATAWCMEHGLSGPGDDDCTSQIIAALQGRDINVPGAATSAEVSSLSSQPPPPSPPVAAPAAAQLPKEPSFLSIIDQHFEIALEVNGKSDRLRLAARQDPWGPARAWCAMHGLLVLSNINGDDDGPEGCVRRLVARANKENQIIEEKSIDWLVQVSAHARAGEAVPWGVNFSTLRHSSGDADHSFLSRDGFPHHLGVERPLQGELYAGRRPLLQVSWPQSSACGSAVAEVVRPQGEPATAGDREATVRLVAAFTPSSGATGSLRCHHRWRGDGSGDGTNTYSSRDCARSNTRSTGAAVVVMNRTLGPEVLAAGRWTGLMDPYPGSENGESDGAVNVFLEPDGGQSRSNAPICVSASVRVGHVASPLAVVTLERGDRGGASVYSTLQAWALARHVTLPFAGSLRPLLLMPQPLLETMG